MSEETTEKDEKLMEAAVNNVIVPFVNVYFKQSESDLMQGMFLAPRRIINVSYTHGTVHPYEDYPLPELLKRPLIHDDSGDVVGYLSHGVLGRSVLITVPPRWFKYKGYRPVPDRAWFRTDEPLGGMSAERCDMELKGNGLVHKKFEEFGLNGPLIPAGNAEYEMPFNGDKVHAAILQCFGDTRLDELSSQLLRKVEANPGMFTLEHLGNLYKNIATWIGFSHSVLKEANIMLPEASFGNSNYAVYRVGDGFGICRVDMDDTRIGKGVDYLRDSGYGISRLHDTPTRVFLYYTIGERRGIPKKRLEDYQGISFKEVDDENEERIFFQKEDKRVVLASKHKQRFIEDGKQSYFDAFDGKTVPEPIERDIILEVFS